jgi:hypothetical protein
MGVRRKDSRHYLNPVRLDQNGPWARYALVATSLLIIVGGGLLINRGFVRQVRCGLARSGAFPIQ